MIRKALPSDARDIAQVHINSWQHAYRDLMPAHYLDSLDATLAHRESNWVRSKPFTSPPAIGTPARRHPCC